MTMFHKGQITNSPSTLSSHFIQQCLAVDKHKSNPNLFTVPPGEEMNLNSNSWEQLKVTRMTRVSSWSELPVRVVLSEICCGKAKLYSARQLQLSKNNRVQLNLICTDQVCQKKNKMSFNDSWHCSV